MVYIYVKLCKILCHRHGMVWWSYYYYELDTYKCSMSYWLLASIAQYVILYCMCLKYIISHQVVVFVLIEIIYNTISSNQLYPLTRSHSFFNIIFLQFVLIFLFNRLVFDTSIYHVFLHYSCCFLAVSKLNFQFASYHIAYKCMPRTLPCQPAALVYFMEVTLFQ